VRQARRRRRSRRRGHRVLAVALLGIVVAGAAIAFWADPDALGACAQPPLTPQVSARTSLLYAGDGALLGAVPAPSHREPVALGAMSHWLPEATVAIEDRRFWRHGAFDYEGIARAALADLEAGRTVQGASTITQQLVRDRDLAGERMTVGRKLREACLAVQLERIWPKRWILQAYLDDVFYGEHAYGAEAAAQTFFDRPARDLTLAQAALLAGLPQAPSQLDPLRHPAAARARRNAVLAALRSVGAISAGRERALAAQPLGLRPGRRYRAVAAPAFFGAAVRSLVARDGAAIARRGGLRVRTTLDPRLERRANAALHTWLGAASDPAGALVAIDPATGAVRAMATTAPNMPFNLASDARRQAGSAFKVFTLAAALEAGIPLDSVWNGPPSLTIPDRRCLNATGAWTVHNFADEGSGTMTLAQAIAQSVNTIFAQVAVRVGPARIVAVAHRMGVRSPLTPVCSITLGPEGVSPLEMTSAFATLAAGGVRHTPTMLEQVRRPDGSVIASRAPRGVRALPAPVAAQVTSALEGVVRSGTGQAADIGGPVAGKTGTAENFVDAWFCGYLPRLATCVWIGNPRTERPMHDVDGFAQVVGGSVPARIWHDFMAPATPTGAPAAPASVAPPPPA
jgi:penicillin-binding protein 1A